MENFQVLTQLLEQIQADAKLIRECMGRIYTDMSSIEDKMAVIESNYRKLALELCRLKNAYLTE